MSFFVTFRQLIRQRSANAAYYPSKKVLGINCSKRWMTTSSELLQKKQDSNDRPKASHPTQHQPRPAFSGQPVAELTKEQEEKRSGVPEEPAEGDVQTLGDASSLAKLRAPELFNLHDRTIIITGGGRGLGLTIAQAILESGAHVVCLDQLPEPSQPQWDQSLKYAGENGLSLQYHNMDVTDQAAIKSVFQRLFNETSKHAPVRGLFISAGIQVMTPAVEFSAAIFRKVIDVNLTGTFLCAQAFAREWFSRHPNTDGKAGNGGASIVMTGSMSGHVANLGIECAAYNASKAGVNQLAKNLALEWSRRGVRVNTLSPGYIRTALTAALLDEKPELRDTWLKGSLLGRLSTPDEFRGPVIYLLSDAMVSILRT
ncbi:hypothetical protein L204_105334 [Cryptococcus depauperatus]